MGVPVEVARTSDLKPGEMKKVMVHEVPAVLFNLDGEYYALPDTCTHAKASLSEGLFEEGGVECPLHGARFDVKTGKVLSFPAVVAEKPYTVTVEGDKIFLESK